MLNANSTFVSHEASPKSYFLLRWSGCKHTCTDSASATGLLGVGGLGGLGCVDGPGPLPLFRVCAHRPDLLRQVLCQLLICQGRELERKRVMERGGGAGRP